MSHHPWHGGRLGSRVSLKVVTHGAVGPPGPEALVEQKPYTPLITKL